MRFNKIISECVKNMELLNSKNKVYVYNSEKDYLNSLKNKLGKFTLTLAEKKSINCILYNNKNNDGTFSASIVYHYLKNNNNNPLLLRIGEGEKNLDRIMNIIRGKTLIILDLEYSTEIYKKLSDICKQIIVIDDHSPPNNIDSIKNLKIFSGNHTHGTTGFVWQVFYPTQKVPSIIQMIDVSDSKKHAKHLPYTNFLSSALGIRYMANPKITMSSWESGKPLDEIWDVIENDNEQFWVIIGSYMDEVQENIKEQIARNAQIRNFQGYKVGVLNFSDPVLTKRIGRQINSNLEGKIDFVLLWAYEHNKECYRIQLIDDHKQTKINMKYIAEKMGKIGGHRLGGGGHAPHIGNFYWPRDKNHDIWDLFNKKYL